MCWLVVCCLVACLSYLIVNLTQNSNSILIYKKNSVLSFYNLSNFAFTGSAPDEQRKTKAIKISFQLRLLPPPPMSAIQLACQMNNFQTRITNLSRWLRQIGQHWLRLQSSPLPPSLCRFTFCMHVVHIFQ